MAVRRWSSVDGHSWEEGVRVIEFAAPERQYAAISRARVSGMARLQRHYGVGWLCAVIIWGRDR